MILSILLVVGITGLVMFPVTLRIDTPRLTIPEITLPGSSFDIDVRHSTPFTMADWRVRLLGKPGLQRDLTITQTTSSFGATRIRVRIPNDLPAGGYSLWVARDGQSNADNAVIAENAVHLRESFSDSISLVQLADLPTLGGDGSGDKRLATIIDEINIINPDVVLFTGDLAYGGSWDQYERLLAQLKRLDVPVIAVPGNHAYYGWAGYLTLLGRPYHQVTMGAYQFLNLNSGHGRDQLSSSQLQWLEDSVVRSKARFRIVQLHHPIHHRPDLTGYLRANRDGLLRIIKDSDVLIVLSGHWHGDAVYDANGTERTDTWEFDGPPFVVTTTAGADFRPAYSSSPLHYGYRFIRINNGVLENYTYDYDGDGVRDAASSIPMGQLSVQPRGRFGVTVQNRLNEGFSNARIKLRIPDAENGYYPSLGKVDAVEKQNGEVIYAILVDLPANSTTAITMIMEGYNE